MSNDIANALVLLAAAFVTISAGGLGWLHWRMARDDRAFREELEHIGAE